MRPRVCGPAPKASRRQPSSCSPSREAPRSGATTRERLLLAQLGRLVRRHLVERLLQLPNRRGRVLVLVVHRDSPLVFMNTRPSAGEALPSDAHQALLRSTRLHISQRTCRLGIEPLRGVGCSSGNRQERRTADGCAAFVSLSGRLASGAYGRDPTALSALSGRQGATRGRPRRAPGSVASTVTPTRRAPAQATGWWSTFAAHPWSLINDQRAP
jgi:hypothetical protein